MKRKFFLGLAFFLMANLAFCQIDLNEKVKSNPDVRTGTLENGLQYYIRHNETPKDRAELRLAVKTGSIMETEGQRGLAHFTEHMAFNGTEHFEKNELISTLERMGVKFGAELNAYTSFDETVYELSVPLSTQGMLDTAMLVLEDWSHNLNMSGEEIDKERGVIMEEWRLGLGADDRMRKQFLPILFKGSHYADRMVIGLKDVIEGAPHDTLRAFYNTWYRPNLQAIIVVGDVDVDKLEQQIKGQFAKYKNPADEKERKYYDIPDNDEPLIAVASDPEATNTNVSIFFKRDKVLSKTLGDIRKEIKNRIYTYMLSARLREAAQDPASPFNYAYSYFGDYIVHTKSAFVIGSGVKEGKALEAIDAIITENERVKQFGFTESELARQKAAFLSSIEAAAKEYGKQKSSSLARGLVNGFLLGEPVPSITAINEYAKELMPTFTLKEFNELAASISAEKNMVVLVTSPEKEGVKIPTVDEVKATVVAAGEKKLEAYKDEVSDEPLLDTSKIKPGKVVSREDNKEFGYTVIKLSNGTEVTLKPTDYKNDQILFSAYHLGGSSLYADQDIPSVNNATSILDQSGLANFDQIALDKKLSGKQVNLNAYISDAYQGLSGSSTVEDFNTMMDLLYLNFTAPREDKKAFGVYVNRLRDLTKNQKVNPMVVFFDTIVKVATNNDPRTKVIYDEAYFNGIKQDKILEVHKQLFSNADNYKFYLVGNFDVDKMIPVLEKYIGGLPAKTEKSEYKVLPDRFPEGINEVKIYAGAEPKSFFFMLMKEEFDYSRKNSATFKMMTTILTNKLRETLREAEGGVYTVSAQGEVSIIPDSECSVNIVFGCNPEKLEKLKGLVFDVMNDLKENGPSKDDLLKVKETSKKSYEKSVQTNGFWLSALELSQRENVPLLSVKDYEKMIESIKIKDIKNAANEYLNEKNYVMGLLYPEADKK